MLRSAAEVAVARLNGDQGMLGQFDTNSGALRRRLIAGVALSLAALAPGAHASFLPPEMMDAAAMGIAWFVIVFVPIGAIVLFWLVHVLPEKIAHKRHHPQRDAIQTLCLLSLAFGGLLWPLAWLWAYTKPVMYRHAYGTEKHDDHYHQRGELALAGELPEHELAHLRDELDAMAARGGLSVELRLLREKLAAASPAPAAPVSAQPAPAGAVAAQSAPAAAQAAPTGSDAKAGGA